MSGRAILIVAVVASLAAPALAGQMSWYFQDTRNPGSDVALAMRGGDVWPVIFSRDKTLALMPTGWQVVGTNQFDLRPMAASSPTGEVAAVGITSGGEPYARGVVSGPTGWQSLYTAAVTFDSTGRLWTADKSGNVSYRQGSSVYTLPNMGFGAYPAISIAVSRSGEVGAVIGDGPSVYYAHYSPLTNTWTKGATPISTNFPIYNARLTFDQQDVPHVVGVSNSSGGDLWAYDFSVMTASWQPSLLAMGLTAPVPLAASANGTLGTAYVANGGLYYTFRAPGNYWTTVGLPTGGAAPWSGPAPMPGMVGLAYDFENTPVLAYGAGGSIYLAYDPVLPEPVSLALLGVGAGGLVWRRRRPA